jgi:hypothetical protein
MQADSVQIAVAIQAFMTVSLSGAASIAARMDVHMCTRQQRVTALYTYRKLLIADHYRFGDDISSFVAPIRIR